MSPVPLTILSIIAYVGGIILLLRFTPQILKRKYDEGFFMVFAAADIFGGLLVFSAVGVTFALFNGVVAIRVFDFFLLAVIIGISLRLAFRSFRPRSRAGLDRISGVLAGSYCVLLVVAALYALVTTVV
jgi:hypothetical protein